MENTVEVENDTETLAAFEASFSASPTETVEPKVETVEAKVEPEIVVKEEAKEAPATALSEQQLKLLAAIPELERRLTQQVDRVSGNYGEVKRLLDTMQKAAATPQSAAVFDASEDSLDQEFPELAQGVAAKIAKAMSSVQTGMTAEQFETMYQARREVEKAETFSTQLSTLKKAHPDHIEIQQAPEWTPWLNTLNESQRDGVMNSFDPYYVSSMITRFKTYRDKQVADATKDKQRVERAVSPSGVQPRGSSTITEDEAMRKAFNEALHST